MSALSVRVRVFALCVFLASVFPAMRCPAGAASSSPLVQAGGLTKSAPGPIVPVRQAPGKTGTIAVLTSTLNPAAMGEPVTFTLWVSVAVQNVPLVSWLSGAVTFMDGTTPLTGTGFTFFSGPATFALTFTPSSLALGSHSITASFAGDADFEGCVSPPVTEVILEPASVTLASSPGPTIQGRPVTFTAMVSPVAPATGTPTGTVVFLDGTTALGTQALSNGAAAFTTSTLSGGSHSITASYSGDSVFGGAVSATVNQAVFQVVSVALTSSVNPAIQGQPVTFMAAVSPDPPVSGTPTGAVTFLDGANVLGSQVLSNGAALFTTSALPTGLHPVTVSYSGDAHFPPAASGLLNELVGRSGSPWAWGSNNDGQLGDGLVDEPVPGDTSADSSVPVRVSGLTGVLAVSGGEAHSLALKSDGTVWAWGDNSGGQLGDGLADGPYPDTSADTSLPVQVIGPAGTPYLTSVVAIAAGYDHSLALKSDGTVWAWGDGSALGSGSMANSSVPVQVKDSTGASTLGDVVAIAAGNLVSLALKRDGTVWAWGYNGSGALGNGSWGDSSLSVQVKDPTGTSYLTGVTAVAAGEGFSLALKRDGTAWAWGDNGAGQLGDGLPSGYGSGPLFNNLPVQVEGIIGLEAVAAGGQFSLALKNDGTVWAWGGNFDGVLGDGTTTSNSVPAQVNGPTGASFLSGAAAVAAGDGASLALKSDGTLWAWGEGSALGDGSTTNSSVPVQVSNLTGVFAVAAGGEHNLAISAAGPSVAVTSSLNPSVFGQPITFIAGVSAVAPAAGTPTGAVTFLDGMTTLGTQTLSAGAATLTISSLAVGSHTISVSYSGDGLFGSAVSAAITQVVSLGSATVGLASSQSPSLPNRVVTFTATVLAVPPAAGTPSGTVTFLDGTTVLGTQALSSGAAAFSTSTLSNGAHPITASYSGDSGFGSAQAILTEGISTSWLPVDISVGADNLSRVLWTYPDGRATLWSLERTSGNYTQGPVFGPFYVGQWQATRIACGFDGVTNVLWHEGDGTVSLWWVNADNTFQRNVIYGPFAGWRATDIAVDRDNLTRILWTNVNDGRAVVWSVASNGWRGNDQNFYGPYPGYTPVALACGFDGLTRLLWANPQGIASLWFMNPQNQALGSYTYGPYAGWIPTDIGVGSDKLARVLWTNTGDGRAVVWSVDASGNPSDNQNFYGPYPGYTAQRVACGPDGFTRLTWLSEDGILSFWHMAADNTLLTFNIYGPYF